MKTQAQEFRSLLVKSGWKNSGNGPWCWYRPQLPAAFHTLQHALDIQKSLKRGER